MAGLVVSACLVALLGFGLAKLLEPEQVVSAQVESGLTTSDTVTGLVTVFEMLPALNLQSGVASTLQGTTAKMAAASDEKSLELDRKQIVQFGTGFVLDGKVVTNRHVVANERSDYLVQDNQGRIYMVQAIYRSDEHDIAILMVADFNLPSLILGETRMLQPGEKVTTWGTEAGSLTRVATTGELLGTGRSVSATASLGGNTLQLHDLLAVSSKIMPGSSGGVVVDSQGKVIGLNVATDLYGGQATSYAISVEQVKLAILAQKNTPE
jgi:S1-C subfamily serine protease